MFDLKDTLRRLRHAGRNFDLSESSTLVKLTDALLSIERDRLDRAVSARKKTLGEWAGFEIDRFWGQVLSLERIASIEGISEYLGDPAYLERIRRFMEAATFGGTLEAVRVAAESGSGVEMRIERTGTTLLLVPQEPLDPEQESGALRAARRVAPAKSLIEINQAEGPTPQKAKLTYSRSNYIGQKPKARRMDGPRWDSDNMLLAARSDKWLSAGAGTLAPGNGLPSNLVNNGSWHTPILGFGATVTLDIDAVREPLNHIRFEISRGDWLVTLKNRSGPQLFSEKFYAGSELWIEIDEVFDFVTNGDLFLSITNIDQNDNDLFVRELYVGARVDSTNRTQWLSLGGIKGKHAANVVDMNASGIINNEPWLSGPAPSRTSRRTLYATLSEVPSRVTSIGFKTTTPGIVFKVYYSNDRLPDKEDFPNLEWKPLPGSYTLKSGRVRVNPFVARHIKLEFSNLHPMMLYQFDTYEEK